MVRRCGRAVIVVPAPVLLGLLLVLVLVLLLLLLLLEPIIAVAPTMITGAAVVTGVVPPAVILPLIATASSVARTFRGLSPLHTGVNVVDIEATVHIETSSLREIVAVENGGRNAYPSQKLAPVGFLGRRLVGEYRHLVVHQLVEPSSRIDEVLIVTHTRWGQTHPNGSKDGGHWERDGSSHALARPCIHDDGRHLLSQSAVMRIPSSVTLTLTLTLVHVCHVL